MKANGNNSFCRALAAPIMVALFAVPGSVVAQQYDGSGAGPAELNPAAITKYETPMIIPPAIPKTGTVWDNGVEVAYYEIAQRQFDQQILPTGFPATTVWSYGSVQYPGTVAEGGTFNYPAFTIEAKYQSPVRVKWINDLVNSPETCGTAAEQPGDCNYLPHLLPVDQTLHWANPAFATLCKDGSSGTDCRTNDPSFYTGPVPMSVHVHGAETYEWADGYPEAWWLPAASNLNNDYALGGSFFDTFKNSSPIGADWTPGAAVYQYPNDQEATTLWYHDHSLGMTRLNVYAGPAGFYLLRGGPNDKPRDLRGKKATLPGPEPAVFGKKQKEGPYDIPIVIQDRSFFVDGSLAYPDNRAFFEGLDPDQLEIPFTPDTALGGDASDVAPIWLPEFFGNTMVVNGNTWPGLDVEPRRYRFRLLNGSQSRFLILQFSDSQDGDHSSPAADVAVWQIGAEQGFLATPVNIGAGSTNGVEGGILLGPAERADMIIDFGTLNPGDVVYLRNFAPDDPFGGGIVGADFDPADPETTGQVMMFRVGTLQGRDNTTPPEELVLPALPVLPMVADNTRQITLNELESETVCVTEDDFGNLIEIACTDAGAAPFGPTEARLGVLDAADNGVPLGWAAATTENAGLNSTEVWEIYNFTADAHPIHIHLIQFQVVDRQLLGTDEEGVALQPAQLLAETERAPESWESGFKDTVIAYPGEVTRVKALFPLEGLFVWHCHILEHEDNEMMRPYCVGNSAACQQHNESAAGH